MVRVLHLTLAECRTCRRKSMGKLEQVLERRIQQLRGWMEKNGRTCWEEQRHLEEGTAEQVYWHCGYLSALQDVLTHLAKSVN